jgi:glycosyltransferase involved in cell wall biosynthesis
VAGDPVPLVSIGLPVYNGERHLRQALDSMLAQTFEDFELIISDNASTDATEEICRTYAARDARIRYSRNATNVGAQLNHHRVFRLARGTYFKWAGHDDMLAPDFLRRCVAVLDNCPEVVLCFSRLAYIDDNGARMDRTTSQMHFCASTAHERLRAFFACDLVHQTIYGLMRTDVLRQTPLEGNWWGADRALLTELSLRGCYYVLPDELFFHREHPGRSPYQKDTAAYHAPRFKGKANPGHWKHLVSAGGMLFRVPMSNWERLLCVAEFGRRGTQKYQLWLPILTQELYDVIGQAVKTGRTAACGHHARL